MENNLFIFSDNINLLEMEGVVFKYLHSSCCDPYKWVLSSETGKYDSNFDAVLCWYL